MAGPVDLCGVPRDPGRGVNATASALKLRPLNVATSRADCEVFVSGTNSEELESASSRISRTSSSPRSVSTRPSRIARGALMPFIIATKVLL